MVDKDIIQRKLSFIDLKLGNLETLKRMEGQDFLASFQAVDAAKYNLQVCIEALKIGTLRSAFYMAWIFSSSKAAGSELTTVI